MKSQSNQAAGGRVVLEIGIRMGLIGGVVAVIIALQGMIQAFSSRDVIGGVFSLSQVLLLVTFFASGYAAINRGGFAQLRLALGVGALAGVVSSILVVALIWLGGVINLGDMFVNATPQLYDLLTFKQGLTTGSLILLVLGAVLGAVPALINILPVGARGPILISLVTVLTFGVLQDLIRVTLSGWTVLAPVLTFLYVSNGLTITGAITLFVVVGALSYLWRAKGAQVQNGINALPLPTRRALRWSSLAGGVVIMFLLPVFLGLYLSEVLDNVGLYILMGLGLNIVVGFAGLLDLGYVAFFAIGAYTVGVLTSPELSTGVIQNWWIALPFAVAMATSTGFILGIPVLKMRGDYLAIVTLGFGEIIRLLVLSDFLKPWLGGSQGIQLIAKPDIGPIQFGVMQFTLPLIGPVQYGVPQQFYYVILAGCLLAAFVAVRVKNSRLGRAWMAMREDEDVAQSMGIDLVATKLLAFAMGAAFGGLSGAIFASKIGSAYASSFNFLVSINVLSLIIIGGMGSIPGVIVGALALVGLPELLREFADYRYLLYGVVLVVMMLTRPEGLVPEARRAIELEEFREEKVAEESAAAAA